MFDPDHLGMEDIEEMKEKIKENEIQAKKDMVYALLFALVLLTVGLVW